MMNRSKGREMSLKVRKKAPTPDFKYPGSTRGKATAEAPPNRDRRFGEARAGDVPHRAHRNEFPGSPP